MSTGTQEDGPPPPAEGASRAAAPGPGAESSQVPGSARQSRGTAGGPATVEVAARVIDLVKTYPAGRARRAAQAPPEVRASDGITLAVRRGEIFGLLGPNGAGKSTLVRQLTGLLRPDSGTIRVLGHDLVRHPERAARLLAYLGQESSALDELTVALAVETTGRLRGLDAAAARRERDAVLAELHLGDLAGRPLARLSGGQRRLACVAAALVGERPLLVLDEPTSGMDPLARRAVWAAIDRRRAERGVTVVLVTHNVIEAEMVLDRVAVIDRGRMIACDTPGGLKGLVGDDVRLELVWRDRPPLELPEVAALWRLVRGNAVPTEQGERRSDAATSARVVPPRRRGGGTRSGAGLAAGAGDGGVSDGGAPDVGVGAGGVADGAAGRRWTLRLAPDEARAAVTAITGGPAFAALDDFTLSTPSLEDVYLALGGRTEGLVKG